MMEIVLAFFKMEAPAAFALAVACGSLAVAYGVRAMRIGTDAADRRRHDIEIEKLRQDRVKQIDAPKYGSQRDND